MKELILEKLKCFEQDDKFSFNPKYHKYTYDGEVLKSVTTLVSELHEKFDFEGKSKKKAEEVGVDQNWIKAEWYETNRYANEIGTATHQWIEDYYNKKWNPLPTNPDLIHRINKFNKIYCKYLHKLTPVKFEVRLFSKKWKLAGTLDGLFLMNDKLYILDYKTNKVFKDDNHKDGRWRKLLPPFNSFYENHHNEYSIQLCLYTLILEEWGINVSSAYIIYIGPDEEDAKFVKVKDMREYIKQYFESL